MYPYHSENITDKQKTIHELRKTNVFIANILTAQKHYGWTWERTLEELVIVLVNHSDDLTEQLIKIYALTPINITVSEDSDIFKEYKKLTNSTK